METPKFKMTFKNSWWQCIVALLLFKPIEFVLAIVLAISAGMIFGSPLPEQTVLDIQDISAILSLVLIVLIARSLSKSSWKRQNKKLIEVSQVQAG